jgi:hypothetical protein
MKYVTLMRDLRVEDEPCHNGASHHGHYINSVTDFDTSSFSFVLCVRVIKQIDCISTYVIHP